MGHDAPDRVANTALAIDHLRAGRHREALADLDLALAANPDDHAARYHRGMAYRHLGSFDLATKDLDLAVEQRPEHRDSRIERALVSLDLDAPDRALADLDAVLSVDPTDRAALRLSRQARRRARATSRTARSIGAIVLAATIVAIISYGGWAAFAIVVVFLGSLAVHELGHLIAARRAGLPVAGLWLGVGPRLIWGRSASRVEYGLRLLPLGAYVRLQRHEYVPDLWKRHLGFFAAGPAANLALAWLLAWGIVAANGVPTTDLTVESVEPRGIAQLAGIRPADRLVALDEQRVRSVPAVSRAIGALRSDEPIHLTFRRGGDVFGLAITGRDRRLLGLNLQDQFVANPSVAERLSASWSAMWRPEDVIGDPRLVSLSGIRSPLTLSRSIDAVRADPFLSLLVVAIAWNGPIGLLNLVPIPPFDGGQMIRVLIRRHRAPSG